MSDYAVTAEFYDVMAAEQHALVAAEIAAALNGLDTRAGPVVDIGAGTGLATLTIARTLPDAEILAVEPDPTMRAALMTRVWADQDLRRRVSVLPQKLLSAPLPTAISGAVACGSLVHFDPLQRQELWALLADRLSPGGKAVFEIQCSEAVDVPEACIGNAQVGRVSYEGRASARSIDRVRQHWRISYISRLDGLEVSRQCAEYECWAAPPERVLAEVGAFGLAGNASGTLVILEQREGKPTPVMMKAHHRENYR